MTQQDWVNMSSAVFGKLWFHRYLNRHHLRKKIKGLCG